MSKGHLIILVKNSVFKALRNLTPEKQSCHRWRIVYDLTNANNNVVYLKEVPLKCFSDRHLRSLWHALYWLFSSVWGRWISKMCLLLVNKFACPGYGGLRGSIPFNHLLEYYSGWKAKNHIKILLQFRCDLVWPVTKLLEVRKLSVN